VVASSSASAAASGSATLTLPSWASVASGQVFSIGYQSPSGQATFSVSSATFN
jgi:hypothetical protein